MAFKKKSTARSTTVEEAKADEVKTAVGKLTAEKVTQNLAAAQLTVQKGIAQVSTDVVQLFAQKETLEADIALKESTLKNLHDIEVAAETLDRLNGEIEEGRQTWADEQAEKVKDREREEEAFTYERNRRRKQLEDAQKDQDALRHKAFSDREAALKAQEQELVDLRAAAAAHPAALETAKAEALVEGKMDAGRSHGFETRALKTEHASEKAVLTLQAQHLQALVTDKEATIARLQGELAIAHASTKELATKVTEAANNRELVASLQQALSASQGQARGSK